MNTAILNIPLHKQKMSSSTHKKQAAVICENPPLTQVLNHLKMEMQQQSGESAPAGKPIVSHVPVSVATNSNDSASTLCSLSSKEGSVNGDASSPTRQPLPLNESIKPNKRQVPSTGSVSSATTRPIKRARRVSTDEGSSSITSPKAASPLQASPLLLAQDEDHEHLSPLHVFVRKQIEIFTATPTELAQPAPGRKQPIQLHQVGLRCIHCRNVPSSMGAKKTKVKRAVCYPSAIGRIYHSVSDMKFDHFTHCKSIPTEVRQTFESLKAASKSSKEKQPKSKSGKGSSSSSTSKYYRDSAARMGLVDGPAGIIYMGNNRSLTSQQKPNSQDAPVASPTAAPQLLQSQPMTKSILQQQQEEYAKFLIQQQNINTAAVASMLFPQVPLPGMGINPLATAMNSSILQSLLMNAVAAGAHAQKSIDAALRAEQQKSAASTSQPNGLKQPSTASKTAEKIVLPLAAPEDAVDLNPLHCFVRKHVELFSADKSDTEAPCPGRKTRVTLGQVGIRCKHCAKHNLKPRERVKRAVCYPPSIDGIYHSVSNMKFDHFGICPCLPEDAKEELAQLKASYSGRNIGNTNTAKYYRESAVSKGLVDTEKGIRFCESHSAPAPNTPAVVHPVSPLLAVPAPSIGNIEIAPAPTGISALMMAAATHATSI